VISKLSADPAAADQTEQRIRGALANLVTGG
jgi:hypothetical protein